MTASGSESTPLMMSSSRTLSKAAESEPPSSTIGIEHLELVAENVGLHDTLTSTHPVLVSSQCVDLTIVSGPSQRLRAVPGGKCVGRETTMDESEMAFIVDRDQIVIVLVDLNRCELTLVTRCSCCSTSIGRTRLERASCESSLPEDIKLLLELDLRNSSGSVISGLFPVPYADARTTKGCNMIGSLDNAAGPSSVESRGTSRHPSVRRPSSVAVSSKLVVACFSISVSGLKNKLPTAYCPCGGNSMPTSRAKFLTKNL